MLIIYKTSGIASTKEASLKVANLGKSGPKSVLCIIHKIYPAVKIIPKTAITVGHGKAGNVPRNTKISDTNPLRPGSPKEANPAIRNAIAMNGIRLANPPKSGI